MNKKLLSWLLVSLFLFLVVCFIPKPDIYKDKGFSRAIYDRNGALLRLILSPDEKYRLRININKIAPVFKKATLLYEDKYFYSHYGVNPVALLKAAWTTYIAQSARVGASTITMQLARLSFNLKTQTISGKLKQIFHSLRLEIHYSKNEILEAYFNLAPYGGNIEGIEAASLIYFNKPADKISLNEALALAVIPQSPVYRSLDKGSNNPGLLRARKELIMRWLAEHHDSAYSENELNQPLQARSRKDMPFSAPHFVEAYLQHSTLVQNNYSSLDISLQTLLERNIKQYIEQNNSKGIYNASAMLLDYRDMSIRAMVGSADYFNESIHGQVNGTAAARSPGSTLKPFIYALAMQQGLIHTHSLLKDAPKSFAAYNPENYDRDFVGPINATSALIKSRNIPALSVASQLKDTDLYDFLKQAQIPLPQDKKYYGLSLVLGGAELSMQSLVKLYALLANQGKLQQINWSKNDPLKGNETLLSAESSYLALNMLRHNPRPKQTYNSSWLRNPLPVYWKTGTSYGYRDAWSIGVFGPYVLAVWAGNFQGHGNPVLAGRRVAGPLFFSIIDAIKIKQPDIYKTRIFKPDPVKEIKVCAISGQLLTPHCKVSVSAGFIPGVSPITKCSIHRTVHIDNDSGLRACFKNSNTTEKLYEFWPSDLLSVFKQAGISRRLPPPYPPACNKRSYSVDALKPEISSPLNNVTYIYRSQETNQQIIPFSAITDAHIRKLYWFLNESYLGTTAPGQPYYWHSKIGSYFLRVIDDHGGSDTKEFKVSGKQ
ncbi:MAG: penicillin-binding protein 1C [Gammaproteobacteria bacterium]|nr:penicillin-binding protein 1C [Gammaproteobacteria bacterium]